MSFTTKMEEYKAHEIFQDDRQIEEVKQVHVKPEGRFYQAWDSYCVRQVNMNCVAERSIEDDSWHMQSKKANKNRLSDRCNNKVLVKLRLSDVREFSSLEKP